MKHLETSYLTHDGLKLFLQAWLPDAPKAGLLLIHGMGEHSGRYAPLVEKLVAEGIAVFTFDGRGHGRSVDWKPDAYFASYQDYLEDIDALYGKVCAYLPGLPTFLYGHSMGGGMAAAYVIKYQPKAAGVILSSPAIKEAEGTSKFLIAVSGIISKWLPRLKALKLDATRISRIPEEVQSYLSDPLNYTQAIPARTAHEVYQMMQVIQADAASFELPVLVVHGTEDGLTNPKGSELLVQKAQSEDKTLRLFPGGYHELIHDLDREELIQTVVDWVKERM
ncbi:alpha/beta hydrolase [Algoriphagus sp. AK58]|uniref:alpha/beta hydrolase n=1 Tax=Algoriphagus sp. AK58 TaxID=1406877 RepID=UPI00164FBDBE|nr:alpha/beta hydrolase [Algoriphagus sp. AK58]MBC6367527.1 alpha/beta hydrolase [Algoriphagus sp. AK58]